MQGRSKRLAVVTAFAMVLSFGIGGAVASPPDKGGKGKGGSATMTGDFNNGCTEFEGGSDKDISNIEVFYADGTSEKYEYRGNDHKSETVGDGRQIDYVVVKSGNKSQRFDCPECQDRKDNDGDGKIDYDKNGDGVRDADSDPDCDSEDDPSENGGTKPECSDGRDNADPEDELADANDPGCMSGPDGTYNPDDPDETDPTTAPECSDGVDNADPEDTLADASDPGCLSGPGGTYDPNDPSEVDPTTGGGRWTCRASALFIENLELEPVVANDANDPCVAEDASVINEVLAGPPGSLSVTVLEAETTATGAESGVAAVTIADATGAVVLSAEVLQSEASGSCVNGQPVLTGESEVLEVTLPDGTVIALTEGEPFTQDLGPLGILHVNYQEQGPTADGGTELVQRAIFLDNNVLLGDVIIAESVVDVHGNPCAA